jgi:hypothetical protein
MNYYIMDLGKLVGSQLEDAASPITGRVDEIITRVKKIEVLLVNIDNKLKQLQPVIDLLKKFHLL